MTTTPNPLFAPGTRIKTHLVPLLMRSLIDADPNPVLVRTYATLNTATSAAWKMTHKRTWPPFRRPGDPARRPVFYSALLEDGTAGVYATLELDPEDEAEGDNA